MKFTVEINDIAKYKERKSEVELYLDKESLEDLLKQLSFLKNSGDHVQFMTPNWGGNELSEEKIGSKNVLIDHLKITYLG